MGATKETFGNVTTDTSGNTVGSNDLSTNPKLVPLANSLATLKVLSKALLGHCPGFREKSQAFRGSFANPNIAEALQNQSDHEHKKRSSKQSELPYQLMVAFHRDWR
jgi:hypothetical protein